MRHRLICVSLLAIAATSCSTGKFEPRIIGALPPSNESEALAAARTNFERGNIALALDSFRRLARISPNDIGALNGIAACYDRMGRFDLSRRYYEQALALEPDNARTRHNFQLSLRLQGLEAEAAALDLPAPAPIATAQADAEASTPEVASIANVLTLQLPPPPDEWPIESAPIKVPHLERLSRGEIALVTDRATSAPAMASAPAAEKPVRVIQGNLIKASDTELVWSIAEAPAAPPRPAPPAQKIAAPTPKLATVVPAPAPVARIAVPAPKMAAPVKIATVAPAPAPMARIAAPAPKVPAVAAPPAPVTRMVAAAPRLAALAPRPVAAAPKIATIASKAAPATLRPATPAPRRAVLAPKATASAPKMVTHRIAASASRIGAAGAKKPVPVEVLNAVGRKGLAARYSAFLRARGWNRTSVADARNMRPATIIIHTPASKAQAIELARRLPFPTQLRSRPKGNILLVLGRDSLALDNKMRGGRSRS